MTPRTALARAAALPARAWHGRPARITARTLTAAAAITAAATWTHGTPTAPAIQAAATLWLTLTTRPELAPPAPLT